MSESLKYMALKGISLKKGHVQDVHVTYKIYGCTLHTAPIILVNHALTGNSDITSWWQDQVGPGLALDTSAFTIIAIDIPGNGHDGVVEHLIYNYQDWTLGDVAMVFIETLKQLRVCYVHVGIGGSIGGALLWEMAVLAPEFFGTIIPIAADWKSTDWLLACCHVQHAILENSSQPLQDARKHAMTFYRTPESLKHKFNRAKENQFKVQSWLNHHGYRLKKRFTLPAYKHVNHLLTTIDAASAHHGDLLKALAPSETEIVIVSIDSDCFFVPQEDRLTLDLLKPFKKVTQEFIYSIHGHDAFLMEHEQVATIINNKMNALKQARVATPCN